MARRKTVQVDTPFGGVHVNTDQTTAADLGLPVYPGAECERRRPAQIRRRAPGLWRVAIAGAAVSYSLCRSPGKVTAFYKKALGRYGDVITCQGNTPVGTPTATAEGLTCADDGNASTRCRLTGETTAQDKTAWN